MLLLGTEAGKWVKRSGELIIKTRLHTFFWYASYEMWKRLKPVWLKFWKSIVWKKHTFVCFLIVWYIPEHTSVPCMYKLVSPHQGKKWSTIVFRPVWTLYCKFTVYILISSIELMDKPQYCGFNGHTHTHTGTWYENLCVFSFFLGWKQEQCSISALAITPLVIPASWVNGCFPSMRPCSSAFYHSFRCLISV